MCKNCSSFGFSRFDGAVYVMVTSSTDPHNPQSTIKLILDTYANKTCGGQDIIPPRNVSAEASGLHHVTLRWFKPLPADYNFAARYNGAGEVKANGPTAFGPLFAFQAYKLKENTNYTFFVKHTCKGLSSIEEKATAKTFAKCELSSFLKWGLINGDLVLSLWPIIRDVRNWWQLILSYYSRCSANRQPGNLSTRTRTHVFRLVLLRLLMSLKQSKIWHCGCWVSADELSPFTKISLNNWFERLKTIAECKLNVISLYCSPKHWIWDHNYVVDRHFFTYTTLTEQQSLLTEFVTLLNLTFESIIV